MKSPPGPPMTLGNAANAKVRLIVWCKTCGHQVEPDPAKIARQYGAGTTVPDWRERLVCSRCGSQAEDMVVTGTERRWLSARRGTASSLGSHSCGVGGLAGDGSGGAFGSFARVPAL